MSRFAEAISAGGAGFSIPPRSLRDALAALGGPLTPELVQNTGALFAPHVLRPKDMSCRILRDQSYGEDPRQRLDIFSPPEGVDCPILLYVPGGGFTGGDKGGEGAPFFNNVGAWAVHHGMVGITMNYRLAPTATWPSGAQDVAAAVRWIRREAVNCGGDSRHIIILGQSAGAAHVAGYLAGHGGAIDPSVTAVALVSGLYDLERLERTPREDAYYGTDRSTARQRSALDALLSTELPIMFGVAEYDPPAFQQQASRAVEAFVSQTGRWPRMVQLPHHNHVSTTMAIGSPYDALGPHLISFINATCGQQSE